MSKSRSSLYSFLRSFESSGTHPRPAKICLHGCWISKLQSRRWRLPKSSKTAPKSQTAKRVIHWTLIAWARKMSSLTFYLKCTRSFTRTWTRATFISLRSGRRKCSSKPSNSWSSSTLRSRCRISRRRARVRAWKKLSIRSMSQILHRSSCSGQVLQSISVMMGLETGWAWGTVPVTQN